MLFLRSSRGISSPFSAAPFPLGSAITLGTGTLSGGVATLTVSSLPAGTDVLDATYGGDAYLYGNGGASVGGEVTVSQAQPTLTLAASKLGSSYGQPVTLTATLSSCDC